MKKVVYKLNFKILRRFLFLIVGVTTDNVRVDKLSRTERSQEKFFTE